MRTPLFALKFLKKYFRVISKKKENKIVRRRLFTQRIGSELTPCVITTGNGTFFILCLLCSLSFSTSFLKIELRKNNHHVKNRHANFLAVAKRGVIFRFAIYAIKNWLIWNLAAA